MDLDTVYVGLGCNRIPGCLALARNGICAFAGNILVALSMPFNPDFGVRRTLVGHQSRINCLEFVYNLEDLSIPTGLLSCSSDGKIIYWSLRYPFCYDFSNVYLEYSWKGHSSSIECLAVPTIPLPNVEGILFATGGSDSCVNIWQSLKNATSFDNLQVIRLTDGHQPTALAISFLPTVLNNIIALASTDRYMYIYIQGQSGKYESVMKIEGHDGWIRGLSFAYFEAVCKASCNQVELLLASACQDKNVRLWKIETSLNDENIEAPLSWIAVKQTDVSFNHEGQKYIMKITLDAVLIGHDGWVYSVSWAPQLKRHYGGHDFVHTERLLVTASSDCQMILWSKSVVLDSEKGSKEEIWKNISVLGELSDSFGFYGAFIGPDHKSVLGHSHTGSLHLWRRGLESESITDWCSYPASTGHTGAVQQASWDPLGRYFCTVSVDQTTRAIAPWTRKVTDMSPIDSLKSATWSQSAAEYSKDPQCTYESKFVTTWVEIGRPQIHGYDMQCIAIHPIQSYRFVSAGDEKVLRVFDGTKSFVRLLGNLAGWSSDLLSKEENLVMVDSADVPALGLTNKPDNFSARNLQQTIPATTNVTIDAANSILHHPPQPTIDSSNLNLTLPPTENVLSRYTYWPEIEKLYGHPHEIYSIALSRQGHILAAACKAASSAYAGLILWRTSDWKCIQKISTSQGHSLTVTKCLFSNNDSYLISVSRDRSICLYSEKKSNSLSSTESAFGSPNGHVRLIQSDFKNSTAIKSDLTNLDHPSTWQLLCRVEKAHARIIWSVTWSVSVDFVFYTVSRDKFIYAWRLKYEKDAEFANQIERIGSLSFEQAVTAVVCFTSFPQALDLSPLPNPPNSDCILLGLEDGSLIYLRFDLLAFNFSVINEFHEYHACAITDLAIAPVLFSTVDNSDLTRPYYLLVSTSQDHSCKLFKLSLPF